MPTDHEIKIFVIQGISANFFLSESENFPPFHEIPPSKKGILFWLIRIPLIFLILPKENSIFEGVIFWKGGKFSLSEEKIGRNTLNYRKFYFMIT